MRLALALLGLGWLAALVQGALTLLLPVWAVPDLSLLATLAAATALEPGFGLVVAVAIGLGSDMISGPWLGQFAFLRLFELSLVRTGVDEGKVLVGANAVAELHDRLFDRAFDLGAQCRFVLGIESADNGNGFIPGNVRHGGYGCGDGLGAPVFWRNSGFAFASGQQKNCAAQHRPTPWLCALRGDSLSPGRDGPGFRSQTPSGCAFCIVGHKPTGR